MCIQSVIASKRALVWRLWRSRLARWALNIEVAIALRDSAAVPWMPSGDDPSGAAAPGTSTTAALRLAPHTSSAVACLSGHLPGATVQSWRRSRSSRQRRCAYGVRNGTHRHLELVLGYV
ncbi:hypothetical protein BV20DRAFT_964538 [Pilatotrama ljubarskyi]|nr:hypothetical protein BV20DRAFT_964538 [Pilatotrama ljubarskyi]